jgi:hypothetical protein
VRLRPLACWDCGFESHRGHGCLSAVSVVCCQVGVSASTDHPPEEPYTDCDVFSCVWSRSLKNEETIRVFEPYKKTCFIDAANKLVALRGNLICPHSFKFLVLIFWSYYFYNTNFSLNNYFCFSVWFPVSDPEILPSILTSYFILQDRHYFSLLP